MQVQDGMKVATIQKVSQGTTEVYPHLIMEFGMSDGVFIEILEDDEASKQDDATKLKQCEDKYSKLKNKTKNEVQRLGAALAALC